MDVVVGASDEVDIPAICPLNLGGFPTNLIRIEHLDILARGSSSKGEVGGGIVHHINVAVASRNGITNLINSALAKVVLERYGMDVKAGNAHPIELGWVLQVADSEGQMVVKIVLILPKASVAGRRLESDGVSGVCLRIGYDMPNK